MIKKIVSFGDSYMYGNELTNLSYSTWPALIAKKLDLEFETCAIAGCGNRSISRSVMEYFHKTTDSEILVVINWAWICSWDFHIASVNKWHAFGGDDVPPVDYHRPHLTRMIGAEESQRMLHFYKDYIKKSELWTKADALESIYSTQMLLKDRGIKSVQTYMDDLTLDSRWHAPGHILILQDYCRPGLLTFQGKNFLDWSREQGFAIAEKWQHPLDDAHQAAAAFWLDHYRFLIDDLDHS
jgi:hypothetical protein